MRLAVATRNKGKVEEIREILSDLPIEIYWLEDFPDAPRIEEDGDTFEENASKKASVIAGYLGMPTIADDSGLLVEALNGEPGVRSARFAGEGASDSDRNAKLLSLLRGVPRERRKAKFVCVLVLAFPDGREVSFRGECEGYITDPPRGKHGFGYDPVFLVPEYGRTFAELGPEVKNRISHRAKALRKLKKFLEEELSDEGLKDLQGDKREDT
ncbi:TPA: XTP/dITP diphosphatase, partial [Candidatus Poribacteria bacterium]|nr:XTP/dITP diphosphatase [Candidatus Poribacteria bacterium]HEX28842.1 XTP/dITP diphosphatase [Candidatus Poribacteria bacterium]